MENLAFRHVIADPLYEFLNRDSKFFATIGLLLVRPWKLTNQFLAERLVSTGPVFFNVHKIRVESDNKRCA